MYLECKNFVKTEKNAFDRGGDHMFEVQGVREDKKMEFEKKV